MLNINRKQEMIYMKIPHINTWHTLGPFHASAIYNNIFIARNLQISLDTNERHCNEIKQTHTMMAITMSCPSKEATLVCITLW